MLQLTVIQAEQATLVWLFAGVLLGVLLGAGVSWMLLRKPASENRAESIGAILVESETPELLLARYDPSGRMVFISQGVHAILGIDPIEFTSGRQEIRSFVHLADLQVLESAKTSRKDGLDQDLQYQYRIRRQDGRWHWMHERQEAIKDSGGTIVAYETLAIDFTDRIRFEKQQDRLRELQRLLTSVLESVMEWEDSSAGLSPTLELLVRYLPLSGASILSIDEENNAINQVAGVARGSAVCRPGLPMSGSAASWWIRRVSGDVSLSIQRGRLSEIEPRLRDAFAAEVDGSVLVLPLLIDGELRYVVVLQIPSDDRTLEPEELSVVQAIVNSMSRQLEAAERHRQEEEFSVFRENIGRSEAVAQFVNGIIHDMNNLIFAASGRIALMLRKVDDAAMRENLEDLQSAINDSEGILKRLLQVGRLGEEEPDIIDPWAEMALIVRTSRRLLPRRIRFETDIRPLESGKNQRMIYAVPQTLQQLILNLTVNSRDAVGPQGKIRVSCAPSNDGQYFEVSVEDDGPGIPPERREEVFEKHVSTKKGTGIGLSICRRVVKEARGTITLGESSLGGLKVVARFPLIEGDVTACEEIIEVEESLEGMIFLIEDNETIREVLVRELESSGAQVVARPDALDAESVMQEHGQEIVLLVFDIDLPERTGVECLEDLRGAGTLTPCLLITGGTSEPPKISATDLLRKPFRTTTLLESCKALISGGNGTHSATHH